MFLFQPSLFQTSRQRMLKEQNDVMFEEQETFIQTKNWWEHSQNFFALEDKNGALKWNLNGTVGLRTLTTSPEEWVMGGFRCPCGFEILYNFILNNMKMMVMKTLAWWRRPSSDPCFLFCRNNPYFWFLGPIGMIFRKVLGSSSSLLLSACLHTFEALAVCGFHLTLACH